MNAYGAQPDYGRISDELIVEIVEPGASVLDLGCGDGSLLRLLREKRAVRGSGVDIEESAVFSCVAKGIPVNRADLDRGLNDYPEKSFDYVILNRTLQVVRRPDLLLDEMMRVGRRVLVNFPNFGFILNRLQLLFAGKMPVNKAIPFQWYDTPNIHFCTRKDFLLMCSERGYRMETEICLSRTGQRVHLMKNLLSTQVCLLLSGE